jgi:hypothetical protein
VLPRACNCAHRWAARGQMVETDVSRAPWWLRVVTQAPVTMPLSGTSVVPPSAPVADPSSGVLPAPPPAPVAVPASDVLQPPPERRTITTIPVKIAPSPRSAETAAATPATRHLRRTAARGATRQKREDVARGVASTRVTTVREMKKTRNFAAATGPGDRRAAVLQLCGHGGPLATECPHPLG